MGFSGAGVCSPAVSTLSWIALVAALVLIVPAAIRIVVHLLPRSSNTEPSGRARALEAVWTIGPFVFLAALIGFSVGVA